MAAVGDNRTIICIFCCKSVKKLRGNGENEVHGDGQQFLHTALIQLGRYLGAKLPQQVLLDTGIFEACDTCGQLLKLFCELYGKMIYVKMQLDWKLETLTRRMVQAGKIPSRIKLLKKVLDKHFSKNNSFYENETGCRVLESIKVLRADVLKSCGKKLSKTKPRVLLERNRTSTNNHISRETCAYYTGEDTHDDALLYNEVESYNEFLLADIADDELEDISEYSGEKKYCPSDDEIDEKDLITKKSIVESSHSTKNQKGVEESAVNPGRYISSRHLTASLVSSLSSSPLISRRSTRGKIKSYQEDIDSEEETQYESVTVDDKGYHICTFCSKRIPRTYKSNVIKHLRTAHSLSLEEAKHIYNTKMDKETENTDEKETFRFYKTQGVREESDWEEEVEVDKGYYICVFCSKKIPRKYKSNVVKHLRFTHSLSLVEAKSIFYTKMAKQIAKNEQEEDQLQLESKNNNEAVDENTQKPFKCSQCSTRFSYKLTMDKHIRKFHSTRNDNQNEMQSFDIPNKPFACTECPSRFRFQGNLFHHMKKTHSLAEIATAPRRKRLYMCRHCKRTFTFKQNLNRHIKTRHGSKQKDNWRQEIPIKIEIEDVAENHYEVGVNFVTREAQEDEQYNFVSSKEEDEKRDVGGTDGADHVEKPFKCDHCFTGFTYEITLQRHLTKYHSYRDPDNANMNKTRDDTGENSNPFACLYCSTCFKYEKNLDYHIRRYHQPGNDKGDNSALKLKRTLNRCSYCRKGFTFKSNLSRHIRNRHKNRNQRLCEKISDEDENVVNNIGSPDNHNDMEDDRPTTPDTHCSADISNTAARHACPVCPKRFIHRQNLYRHRKLNHSKLAMTCKVKFLSKCDQDETIKETTRSEANNEYNFTCAFCPKDFNWKSNVIKHIRFIHKKSLDAAKLIFDTQVKRIKNPLFVKKVYNDDEKPFQCSHCSVGFTSRIAKHRHMIKFHTDTLKSTNPLSCTMCSRTFMYRGILNTHLKRYHNIEIATADQEGERSNATQYNPNRQEKRETFFCSVTNCPEAFFKEDDLEAHKPFHGSFKCSFCTVVKEYAPELSVHEQEEHALSSVPFMAKEEPNNSQRTEITSEDCTYKCPRCEYSSQFRSSYISHHVEIHLGLTMKVLTCDICRMHFRNKDSLDKQHFRTHHATIGVDPSLIKYCNNCPAFFLKQSQIYYHKLNIHGIYDRNTCPECGKYFSYQKNLRLHRKRVHKFDDENPDLPIACTVAHCMKRFATKEDLDWHMSFVRHDISKEPVTCSVCNRQCIGDEGLRSHMKSHGSEYICEQCGQNFQSNRTLQRHYLSHKDPEEWEYMCQACGRKFSTSCNLNRHMKTHLGIKPWKCQLCGKAFREKHKLRCHLNSVHKDKSEEILSTLLDS